MSKRYKMRLSINEGNEGFVLPVLPQEIEISDSGDNKTHNVINLGEVNVINIPKLTKISFKSYFPRNDEPYVNDKHFFRPHEYMNRLNIWRQNAEKIRFIFIGSEFEINDLFSIENLKFTEKGGEVGDIYYSIELKRYKSYYATRAVVMETKNGVIVENYNTTLRPNDNVKVNTHRVVEGETLWHIAKKYLGDGNRYKEIAELNNISNPDLIYPGQVFNIP
ncbi:LysM peptidoglycan-binding domain-containing protein [Clostridium botulinum]|uniref:LysM peptidoglycan-binding domain-containing protein n=1 Tax=Clostridium botulinum TaxID=1491 RepID=UPI000A16CFF2|nr:LysM peptidoglycan-binding domain-containing protein [Clostridium botulinum]MBN1076879.1 LysM peptidoglycan-binding domain-containing protein [Clostridium botulinum]NFE74976.1 LysM peptidoglycan-binding domain-containing protein [Clostridium botulinum]NFL59384.1 LysM peptidoglycan-binding domain-containing protein [Clostridium botulinum]NFL60735.1 LysM peptidoglycan-binding domain-containing protein [Clostridium botulinum]NFO29753.1 LysM peptidoglycan-binding domain-containing protein [Clos